jgi:hypothetical protein
MVVGRRVRDRSFAAAAAATSLALAGCASEAPSPFGTGGAGGAAVGVSLASAGAGGEGGGGEPLDPTLGGPCADDAACDDGAGCTTDRCDLAIGRCRFSPDDAACDDGVFCDGAEVCVPRVGCEPGPPHDCGDDDACTIDTCDEDTRTCTRRARDADGDGDPDAHCAGGADCDDLDPARSSAAPEVCANGADDDCDGDVDEDGCAAPAHDDCDDALAITPDASLVVSTAGAGLDVGTSCAPEGAAVDVVLSIEVPDGPPRDVDARAVGSLGLVGLAIAGSCGDPASELACGGPAVGPDGLPRARVLARSVPPGEVTLVVTGQAPSDVALDVRLAPATIAPANETCGTAEVLAPGVPVEVDVVDAATDLATACARSTGELVYRVDLEAPADVDVRAVSLDGLGLPSVSVRSAACALPEDELACRTGLSPHVHRVAVPAGPLFLALSASAPTKSRLLVELSPPGDLAADERCESAPPVAPGDSLVVDLASHQDDHAPCLVGGVDAAYALLTDEPLDLLLIQRTAPADPGGIALADAACDAGAALACSPAQTPVRLRRRGLGPGDRRVVLESFTGAAQELDVLARPASPPISVPFADGCEDALLIPPGGGFFVGNTAGATADLGASCDDAGGPPGGAPDRLLRLELTERSRVVLDATGSSYRALLDVRSGADCPGVEVPLACTVTTPSAGAAFLDLVLEAGTHHVQIDGRGGESGPFQLDVHVVPAP